MTTSIPEIEGYTILVIGINGFIGCHVATIAAQSDAEVVGVDLPRNTSWAERIRASLGGAKIAIHEVEHLDAKMLKDILFNFSPDMLVHLGGVTIRNIMPQAWTKCAQGNAMLTASILSAIAQMPESSRPVLVMPGSQMEYGLAPMPWTEQQVAMPSNPYGASKLAATELMRAAIRANLFRGCVVRLALVFGPGQTPTMIIPELIIKALKRIDVCVTEGQQQRRFVFVKDAARFLLKICTLLISERDVPSLINAPACDPISIVELARYLMNILGYPVELQVGALPQRENERIEAWPDSTLAESINLISVTPLEKGLGKTVTWYRDNKWFIESVSITD